MYSKSGLIMSIKLQELNCAEMNATESSGWWEQQQQHLAGALWLHCSLYILLHQSLFSFTPFSIFSLALTYSVSLLFLFLSVSFSLLCPFLSYSAFSPSLLTLLIQITTMNLSTLWRIDNLSLSLSQLFPSASISLSLLYLSPSSLFPPLRLPCW